MATEDTLAGEKREREQREFMDALLGKIERITTAQIAALQSFQAEGLREIADSRARLRADTEAVWRRIDERFGPEPAGG